MELEKRLELVQRNAEEVVTEEELIDLLKEKDNPIAYQGFEPSGFMHIAQGMVSARKIKDLQEAGFTVKIFLADWHAYINNKLNGDIDLIRTCGDYLKDSFLAMGVDEEKTEFILATDIMDNMDYWETAVGIYRLEFCSWNQLFQYTKIPCIR